MNTDSTDFGSHIMPLFVGLSLCCSADQNKLKRLIIDLYVMGFPVDPGVFCRKIIGIGVNSEGN